MSARTRTRDSQGRPTSSQLDPFSAHHLSYLAMSEGSTLGDVLAMASWKSAMHTGSLEICKPLISSMRFPWIFFRIPFMAASRHTTVMSSPL